MAGYSFLLTAYDGQRPGGDGSDRLRLKIWNAGGSVYDNASGSDDLGQSPLQPIGGGSIVIHSNDPN